MDDLVGTRELARRMGVSSAAVTKAMKDGRITPERNEGKRPLFSEQAVRAVWSPASIPPPPPAGDDAEQKSTDSDNQRYYKARADKEEALVQQELLELGRLQKELLPASEIITVWSQLLRACSQNLSDVPQMLLSRFPGLTEAGRDFLQEQLRTVLDDLSAWEPE
ncbi:MAG: hypothetical protein LUE17_06750 [Planctomycetaceae bacterium]|nr:hypothetical protein [Planctomycetaceae bacterium]